MAQEIVMLITWIVSNDFSFYRIEKGKTFATKISYGYPYNVYFYILDRVFKKNDTKIALFNERLRLIYKGDSKKILFAIDDYITNSKGKYKKALTKKESLCMTLRFKDMYSYKEIEKKIGKRCSTFISSAIVKIINMLQSYGESDNILDQNISTRAANTLYNNGVKTVSMLKAIGVEGLMSLKGVGPTICREVMSLMKN